MTAPPRSPAPPNIKVEGSLTVNVAKDPFISNKNNLRQLIDLLRNGLTQAGIESIQAEEDADMLIVQSSIESAQTNLTLTHAEDTDVLINLLCSESDYPHDIMFELHISKAFKQGITRSY